MFLFFFFTFNISALAIISTHIQSHCQLPSESCLRGGGDVSDAALQSFNAFYALTCMTGVAVLLRELLQGHYSVLS